MSSVKIQSNASGTGDLIIAAPNTNSTRTINLPDADGDFVTTGDSGTVSASMLASTLDLSGKTVTLPAGTGGKVLQVVSNTFAQRSSTTSSSFVASHLTDSITPTSASSKILVLVQSATSTEATNRSEYITLYRNSTNLNVGGDPTVGMGQFWNTAGTLRTPFNITWLDSPATTSSVSYTVYFRCTTSDYVEIPPSPNMYQQVILMEIAA